MANSLSALNPEVWKPMVQDYLNKMLVANQISNTKCEEYLSSGDQVNFPYVSDVRVQSYTQGTDLTMDDVDATQDSLIVDQSKAATFVLDPVQEKQALADYGAQLAFQSAFQLKNNIDQTLFTTIQAAANSTVAGGALAVATMLSRMNDVYAELARQNATDGELFAVVDPERAILLTQSFVANGFVEADATLRNQFRGRAAGFNVYVSNNLPVTNTWTMPTIPVATDTMVVAGVTITWVAAAAAAAAGEVSIGANVAASQANFVDAINGTGTPGAGTYIEFSKEDRRKLQNAQISASAFAADVSTVTGFGKIGGTEAVTPADAVWGTETGDMLFGKVGAPSLAIQMSPELYIRGETKQISRNYITHVLFGTKVFNRDAFRLVNMSYNV